MKKLALVVVLAWSVPAAAVVVRVPADQPTIQGAVMASVSGDTVLVAPGTYAENIRFWGRSIALLSEAGRDSTVIVAAVAGAVVQWASGEDNTSIIRGFTIDGDDISRGFWVHHSHPTIEACEIRNCKIDDDGAAIACWSGSQVKIHNNLIHDNQTHTTWNGGVIYGDGCELEITDNIIYNNRGYVPGIMLRSGPSKVWRNVLYGNDGFPLQLGAAVWVQGDGHEVINNTIVGNTKGIMCNAGSGLVLNNVVTSNVEEGILSTGSFVIDFNDAWNNGSDNNPGSNGISTDPLFADTAGHDYRLLAGSPCIDAGDPDVRYDDPDGTRCDMGRWPNESDFAYPRPENRNLGPEFRANVVNHTPTFYWSFADTAAGSSQTAYELEVGTDDDWSAAERWATGAVSSVDTFAVYGGGVLLDGTTYFMRIRINNGTVWGDWSPLKFRMNAVPSIPTALVPVGGTQLPLAYARLTIENAIDSLYDILTYDFEVYQDSLLTMLVQADASVTEQTDWTPSTLLSGLFEGTAYWWRARASDGFEYSDWSPTQAFFARPPGGVLLVPVDVPTIQFGINLAVPTDTILAAPGVYPEHIEFLGKGITVAAASLSDSTVIRAVTARVPVVKFVSGEDSTSVLQGITVDGNGQSQGIYCSGTGPIIRDCEIKFANHNRSGGGVVCLAGSTAKIRANRIHDNAVTQIGAAIYIEGSPVEVSGNWIYANTGQRPGIGLVSGTSRIFRNVIYDNIGTEAKWGAGIWFQGDGHQVVNNTVVGNSVGISINKGKSLILNNVVAYNLAEGILDEGLATVDYNVTWLNGSANGPGINGSYINPLFVDSAVYDYRLQAGSPCIDAGHPSVVYDDPDGTRNDVGGLYFDLGSALPLASNRLLGSAPGENVRIEVRDHVINHAPTIYWSFTDTAAAGAPSALEAQVGTDNDWTTAEMWSTGVVTTADTFLTYGGNPLVDGAEYLLRIRLNNGLNWGDWRFLRFVMNLQPSVPVVSSPTEGAVVPAGNVRLIVDNSIDTVLDTLTYDFEVYSDSMLSTPVDNHYGAAEGVGTTNSKVIAGLAEGARYWWRARSYDTFEYSDWMITASFYVRLPGGTLHVPGDVATIQSAIDLAADGDTVLVSPGTYVENIDFLGKGILLASTAGRDSTVIRSAQAGAPVVYFTHGEDSTSVIQGFGINANLHTRGILCTGSGSVVQDCEIWNAWVTDQSGDHGGAISCRAGSTTRIRNNLIHDNYAVHIGAGIFVEASVVEITGNVIYNNSGRRPGIGLTSGPSLISHNVIYANDGSEAQWGAGIWFQGDGHQIVNNTIVGNSIGLSSNAGSSLVFNNIVVSNVQQGILMVGASTVDYNDAWNNGSQNTPGPNGISLDPRFVDSASRDYSLQVASPCIDAGDPGLPADPDGSRSDMGAIAYVYKPGDVMGDGKVSLTDAVYLINFILKGGPPPVSLAVADVNADCTISSADIIYLINYVLKAGPLPLVGCAQPVRAKTETPVPVRRPEP